MKHILLSFILSVSFSSVLFAQQSDGIVFSVNDKPVFKQEVEEAYRRANSQLEEKVNVDDFVQSYINLKLNVEEAKARHLDTTLNYKREYSSYKIQLSDSYLLKTSTIEDLVMQMLFDRTQTEVEINHAFIPFDKEVVFPADTLALYNKMQELRTHVIKNGFVGDGFEDYTKITDMVLDRESKSGYMGWIIPFMMSFSVEDAIYDMPLREISQPIRTKKGYHIVQVLNKRPAQGLIDIDQVLFSFSQIPPSAQQIDSVGKVVNKVYDELLRSGSWDSLCKAYMKANNADANNCNFGVYAIDAQLPPSFLSAAFALEREGDISKPVMTDYGFHIIRLNKKLALPTFANTKEALRKRVRYTDRSEYVAFPYRKQQAEKYHLKVNDQSYFELKSIANIIDPYDSTFISYVKNGNNILFTIDGKEYYKVKDFVDFIDTKVDRDKSENVMAEAHQLVTYNLSTDRFDDLLNTYMYNAISSYAKKTLEEKNPEFGKLMSIFSEETLYFDIMNQNVWIPSKSLVGQTKFYDENKRKYDDKPFEEVKSLVWSDYESVLEGNWINSLRKKYKVNINNSVLKTIK